MGMCGSERRMFFQALGAADPDGGNRTVWRGARICCFDLRKRVVEGTFIQLEAFMSFRGISVRNRAMIQTLPRAAA